MAKTKRENLTIKLVEAVEQYPCLYNIKIPEYARRDITEKAWSKVAEEVKETVTFCEEKWKNLRTVFVRNNKSAPSGSARKSKRPYYLNEHLQFLLPYVKPSTDLTTSGNLPSPTPDHDILLENNEQSDTEDQDEDLVQQEQYFSDKITSKNHDVRSPEEKTKGTKKRKSELSQADQSFIDFVKMKKTKMCGEDPRRMYLLSLLPDINAMTDKQMRIFKKKVSDVIDDILNENPTPQNQTPTSNTSITSRPQTAFSNYSGSS